MVHLVTGGSGSGKSAFAEDRICEYQKEVQGGLFYIATMLPYGGETKQKIMRHRNMRENKGFRTIECYTGLDTLEENESALKSNWNDTVDKSVLLECMSNLVANELYQQEGAGEDTAESVMRGVQMLKNKCRHLVIVTNEVCSESGLDSEEMRVYKQILSKINCLLAEMADAVTEVVYGLPVMQKQLGKTGNYVGVRLKENAASGAWDTRLEDRGRPKEMNRRMSGMKLVIGGAYQGKLAYAKKKFGGQNWTDGADCAFEEIYACGGIFHFEQLLLRMMKAGKDMVDFASSIVERNPEIIIVSAEIGYGLVPIDAFEREYREQTGRVCTELAGRAASVDRVVCGLGMALKGE